MKRVGVFHQQIPHRRDEHRQQQHRHADDLEVRADKGREIVVVDLLGKPQQRGGQQQRRRGVVHHHHHIALHDAGRGHVGTLGVADLRKRVPELPGREGFRHRFLTHGNRAHLHIFQFFSQLRQQAGICLALHVAQHHIGVGAIIQLHPLQRQAGISDTAAQQSGVLHQIFHKAVVAAPEDAAGVRLLNGASGKLLHIHQNTAVPAIDYQQRLAGKHPQHRLLLFQADGSIAGCDKASEKCVRRFHVRQVGCRQPLCDHPLQNTLLRVAVHHPQSGAATANGEIAGRHVEAAPRTQRIVQRRRSGGKFLFHALRPPRAFLDSMGKTA